MLAPLASRGPSRHHWPNKCDDHSYEGAILLFVRSLTHPEVHKERTKIELGVMHLLTIAFSTLDYLFSMSHGNG